VQMMAILVQMREKTIEGDKIHEQRKRLKRSDLDIIEWTLHT